MLQNAQSRYDALVSHGSGRLLAIETSCDETAAAVVENGRVVLSNVVHTQIPLHQVYGGVVPEIASRSHVEMIGPVVDRALSEAGVTLDALDGIAVTHGPGLVGALLVGLNYAKALAYAAGLPFAGVNHIASHIAANYLTYPDLRPPFTCLVASGGHSHIVRVNDYGSFTLIGRTRDDAAGEAFDKIARMLGLPYPGGPALEKLAEDGDPNAIRFHSAFNEGAGFDFSFSGLKTAAINELHTRQQRGEPVNRADVAASFQRAVVEVLAEKSVRAAVEAGDGTLALAGGVSANTYLRKTMERKCKKHGIRFCCPDFRYCTDNAAMVGSAGFYRLLSAPPDALSLNAIPNLSIV
jgi:N6-L-threonylcarbamoyladenine synthase